jgi:hypothetical protein
MENAHLRFGLLEYVRFTEKASTRIRLRVDRYIGEDRQAHLLSVFGNDSDVGAITAAVHEKAAFNLTFPDGTLKDVTLGEHASCYKGAVTLPGRKHPVRHLLAVSQELHTNGSAGRTILLRHRREEAWAAEVIAPHMVRMCRPQPHARPIVEPQPSARLLLLRYLRPFTTPDSLHPILAHLPACMLEQRGDAAIAISPVLLSQGDNGLGKSIFVFSLCGSVALRAAWLVHQSARPTLTHATLTGMAHRTTPSFRA